MGLSLYNPTTLANAYAAGASAVAETLLLDATRGPVILKDNAAPIGTLLQIQSNGGGNIALFDATNLTFGQAETIQTTTGNLTVKAAGVGGVIVQQTVQTTGSPTTFTVNGPAHTTLTIAEQIDANFNFARTVNFAAGGGTIAIQRNALFQAATYTATTNPITITTGATVASTGAPIASTNVTITNPLSFWSQSGVSWFEVDGVAATSTLSQVAVNITNRTAAGAGAQQYSPFLRVQGFGWKTNATAASQEYSWLFQTRPIQGAAAPTGALDLFSSVNNGTPTKYFTLDDTSTITTSANAAFTFVSSPTFAGSQTAFKFQPTTAGGSGDSLITVQETGTTNATFRLQSNSVTQTAGHLIVTANWGAASNLGQYVAKSTGANGPAYSMDGTSAGVGKQSIIGTALGGVNAIGFYNSTTGAHSYTFDNNGLLTFRQGAATSGIAFQSATQIATIYMIDGSTVDQPNGGILFKGGNPGAISAANGKTAGPLTMTPGTGATATVGFTASGGGILTLNGGKGGTGFTSVNGPGVGGEIDIFAGAGGTVSGAFSGANGGNVVLRGGAGTGTGVNGIILLGDANTAAINIAVTAARAAPAAGDIWADATQKTFSTRQGGMTQPLVGTIYTAYATKTVANTITETTLFSATAVGTKTLAANFFVTGKTLYIHMNGVYSTKAITPGNLTVTVYYGSTSIASTVVSALVSNASNLSWSGDVYVTCQSTGATGTVMCGGGFMYEIAASQRQVGDLDNTGNTTTIDTTASSALDIKVTWATADPSNSISATITTVEVLN